MQNADDGVVTLCGLAALVILAGEEVPWVTGVSLVVTAGQAVAGEGVGMRWEPEIETCSSAILRVGQCCLGGGGQSGLPCGRKRGLDAIQVGLDESLFLCGRGLRDRLSSSRSGKVQSS
jgi:hypothetical protein